MIAFLLAGRRSSPFSALGAFLVVEQPLEPTVAIIVLAGQTPDREEEAVGGGSKLSSWYQRWGVG